VERWASTRFPLFLRHLENCLASNRGGTGFFVGDSLTYADIAVFHLVCAAESQLPDRFEALNIPLLKAFQGRIAQRNKIAAYLRSERRRPFSGKAFM
jgi:glutathione S-transferase